MENVIGGIITSLWFVLLTRYHSRDHFKGNGPDGLCGRFLWRDV